MRVALLVLVVAALASGCGQRGNLYLRENPPPGVKPSGPAPYKPVPYPQPAGDDTGAEKKR